MVTGQPTKLIPPPQTDPLRSPREMLPTMYDLPSEDPKEPGLPDEFHYVQPQLSRETVQPSRYEPDRYVVAADMNLYYDLNHLTWYKRPDWFAVLGVSRWYDERDLRLSYVTWQEEAVPFLVVELLSPGTEREDLGKIERGSDEPPTKWAVYEQILRIPYYVVFSRDPDKLQFHVLRDGRYEEVLTADQRLWLPDAGVGLGLWSGAYQDMERHWLRFYNERGECHLVLSIVSNVWPRTSICFLIMVILHLKKSHTFTEVKRRMGRVHFMLTRPCM